MMHSKLRIGNNRPDPPRGHAPLTKPRPMRQLSISHCKANNKGSSTPLTRTQSDLFTAIADGVGDSVSDIGRHLGRLVRRLPTSSSLDTILRKRGSGKGGHENQRDGGGKPVVLILGSGWVGHSMIKVIDTDSFEVVLISPRNFFMFTPMLPSTAVGTVEFRSLLEPIRSSNEFVSYLEATCESVDLEQKVAFCQSSASEGSFRPKFELPYDILVVAVGEEPATFNVPGVAEHCFFMKEINDTVKVRRRISECFELASLPGTSEEDKASLLNFVIVGGGPTGVEFAGTLGDFVKSDLRKKYPLLMPVTKVTLLQSAESILTMFDVKLAQRALENLQSSGVTVRLGVRVVQVTEKEVVLLRGKGGEERMAYGLVVWSCGNQPRPFVRSLVAQIEGQQGLQMGRGAKLAVDGYLRVIGARDVFAAGDCSLLVEGPLPSTAQVAGQQGAYLAHLINRKLDPGLGGVGSNSIPPGRTLEPPKLLGLPLGPARTESYRTFSFFSLGLMAYVGNEAAVTQFEVEAGEGNVGFKLYGTLAFLLWRSVYITKQVSLRNRVLILFDWLKTRVFGRDTSMF